MKKKNNKIILVIAAVIVSITVLVFGIKNITNLRKLKGDISKVPKCIRASVSELHKDKNNYTIGSAGTSTEMKAGDAFICDVNGDGNYNAENEMFYYVSDYYSTNTIESFNSTVATLVYYSNVVQGVPNNTVGFKYHSTQSETSGPTIAYTQLPTTSQWSNVTLYQKTRYIRDDTGGHSIQMPFEYEGKAARLLTYQEIKKACSNANDTLSGCKYLLENGYDTNTSYKYGYWLETYNSSYNTQAYIVLIANNYAGSSLVSQYKDIDGMNGVRPAIDVKKSDINTNLRSSTTTKTITFNKNNSNVMGSDYTQTVTANTPAVLESNNYYYYGHKFISWNTKADGTGSSFNDEDVIYVENSNITLYAQWAEQAPKCKRAKTSELHRDKNNNPIGSAIAGDDMLVGDAFICDVNGDGTFNSSNEMFYYVNNYYDTDTGIFNPRYATLIYYSNVSQGSSNNTTAFAFKSSDAPTNGPSIAYAQLPTTSQWSNISLYKSKRKIRSEAGKILSDFTYTNRAARLLTYKEIKDNCSTTGDIINGCEFLFENGYDTNNNYKNGYWLETCNSTDYSKAYVTLIANASAGRRFVATNIDIADKYGVRPAIDVDKAYIDIDDPEGVCGPNQEFDDDKNECVCKDGYYSTENGCEAISVAPPVDCDETYEEYDAASNSCKCKEGYISTENGCADISTPPLPPTECDGVEGTDFYYDETNSCIYLPKSNLITISSDKKYATIKNNTKVSTLKPSITGNGDRHFYLGTNTNVELPNTNIVATGDIFSFDGAEYTIIVPGDLDSDGEITISDFNALYNHYINKNIPNSNLLLTGVKLKAADINSDNSIDITDFNAIYDLYVNKNN